MIRSKAIMQQVVNSLQSDTGLFGDLARAERRELAEDTAMLVVVGADRAFIRNSRLPNIGSRGAD